MPARNLFKYLSRRMVETLVTSKPGDLTARRSPKLACEALELRDLPAGELSLGPATQFGESDGTAQISVFLSEPATKNVTVKYAALGGTAALNKDFRLPAGTLTFAPGETVKSIPITLLSDTLREGNEQFTIRLTAPKGALLGVDKAVATIVDDESMPTVAFDVETNSGPEAKSATAKITLSNPSQQTITVDYTLGGTATTADHKAKAGRITFKPNEISKTITLPIVNDKNNEVDETIVLTLTTATNATIGTRPTHTYTITNDDALPKVSFKVAASSGAEVTSPAALIVNLSAASGRTVTVNYTVGGTATSSDHGLTAGTVTFAPGTTTQTIALPVLVDADTDDNETVIVTLDSPSNATLGTIATHTYTIRNSGASLGFELVTSSVQEGAAAGVDVVLSEPQTKAVTVSYVASSGTATVGKDFALPAGKLTFAPGETRKTITVTPTDDSLSEDAETFKLTLSAPTNALLQSTKTLTLTIQDNDAPPTVSFATDTTTASEAKTAGKLRVNLSAVAGRAVTVPYLVAGTATNTDHKLVAGTLTIPAGQLFKDIPLTVINDKLDEVDETVIVTLGTPTGATLGALTTHTYTITDDDRTPSVTVAALMSSGLEGAARTIQLKLSAASGLPVTVDYTIGGTATVGTDHTLTTGSVTFAPGEKTKVLTLPTVDDTERESAETVIVTLTNATNATLGTRKIHTATIKDNDTSVTFDITPPTIILNSPLSSGFFTNQNVTINGRVTDSLSGLGDLKIRVNNGPYVDVSMDSTGAFTHTTTLVLNGTADGSVTVLVRATDAAGNAVGRTFDFTLDTVAPAGATLVLAPESDTTPTGDYRTTESAVTLMGMTEPNATVTLIGLGRTTVASSTGAYTFTNVPMNHGANRFRVYATDTVGNTGPETALEIRKTATLNASGDVVLQWNRILVEAIRSDASSPPVATRNMAMVQGAVYDAVSALQGTPGYFVNVATNPSASPEAAVASAAHRVLSYLYPGQKATFDAALATLLGTIADGQAKTDGIALGTTVGDAIVTLRSEDGYDDFVVYNGGEEPGQWRPTPPMHMEALTPQWGTVTPFVVSSAAEYRPSGPPALTSEEYATDYNEVKGLGKSNSTTRTAPQTQIARFWADGLGTYTPPGHWNLIANDVATTQSLDLATSATVFAQLNLALADAAIVVWDTKYEYGLWRPLTAIPEAENDGNVLTEQDDDWLALLPTPNFPEYVSGHSTFSAAAATILTATLGDNIGFSSTSVNPAGITRTFTSFRQAAQEAGRSRIYGGIHYEFSNRDGQTTGNLIGDEVIEVFDPTTDSSAPRVYIDSPLQTTVSATNITIRGHAIDNLIGVKQLEAQVDNGAFVPVVLDSLGNFVFTTALPLDGSKDGQRVVRFRATDYANNVSSATTFTFTLDTTVPTITLTTPTEGTALDAGSRLKGSASGTGSPLLQVTYAFDSDAPTIVTLNSVTGAFDQPFSLAKLAVGSHTLTITARDTAGLVTTITRNVTMPAPLPLAITSYIPADGSIDVGVTVRPQIFFSRPVDVSTLNSNNFYASFAGKKLEATIVPATDGTFAWLFFEQAMPDASLIRVTVDGSTILPAEGGDPMDANRDGLPGGVLTFDYKTVSLVPVDNTSLIGIIADPGPDLKPMTADDARPGPDGQLGTLDDVFLLPIAGVTIHLIGLEDQKIVTGADGKFNFPSVPVGNTKIVLDGLTVPEANRPAGYYFPEMVMDVNIEPGVVNTMMDDMIEAYLPRVANSILKPVDADTGAQIVAEEIGAPNLTPEQRALLTINVGAGSMVDANGQPVDQGQIGISTVPPELVRDMLPPGVLQHTFDITVQAPGVTNFSTPAQMTFPNVFNAAPGSKLDFLSFDHTTGRLVIEGTATVSEDGKTVVTDPDTGVTHPGWHGLTPPGGCGGSGGSPPPPPPPPDESEGDIENEPEEPVVYSLITGEPGFFSFFDDFSELSWEAPDEIEDAPPPPPPTPGCGVPDRPPEDEQQQPYLSVFIDVDGPLETFLNKTGNLDLVDQAFILAAGSDEEKTFGGKAKSYDEMLGSGGLAALKNDQLYGSIVRITEIHGQPDGSRVYDYKTYIIGRWVDVMDAPEAEDRDGDTAVFLKTNTNGFTRTKDVDLFLPSSVTTTFDGGGSEFNFPGGSGSSATWTFTPSSAGNTTANIDIQWDFDVEGTSFNKSLGDLTAKGTGIDPTTISVNQTGYQAALKNVILNLKEDPSSGAISYTDNFTSEVGANFQAEFAGFMPRDRRGPGADTKPGVATVDDDGVNGVDDAGEYGYPGSDDVFTTAQLAALDAFMIVKGGEMLAAVEDDYNSVDGITIVAGSGDVNMLWVDEVVWTDGSHVYGYADFDRRTSYHEDYIASATDVSDTAKVYALAEGLNASVDNDGQFGIAINMAWYSGATFAQFVANTVSHELGHTFGLLDAYLFSGGNREPNDIMRSGNDGDGDLTFDPKNIYLLQASMGTQPSDPTSGVNALKMYQRRFYLANSDNHLRESPPTDPAPDIMLSRGDNYVISGLSDQVPNTIADGVGGTTTTTDYLVTNVGTAPLVINTVALTNGNRGYEIVDTGVAGATVQPGQSVTLKIRFDPTAVGQFTDTVTITSNAAVDPTFTMRLNGEGYSAAPRVNLNIPNNNLGGIPVATGVVTKTTFATVKNEGSQPLVISAIRLAEGTGRFGLLNIPVNIGTTPITLNFGESFTFGVQFDPDHVGLDRALIDIVSNDPTRPLTRISAVGTGLDNVVFPVWGDDFQAVDLPDVPGAETLTARSDDEGNFSFFLPPEQFYRYRSFDPDTGLIAYSTGTTPPSGRGLDLTWSLIYQASTAPDTDYDGLPDDIEHTIGTFVGDTDTNNDGLDDYTSIQQDLDALGDNALPVGIVGTVRPAGNINVQDVVASSTNAYLATGAGGVQVVDISRVTKPVVVASVPAADLGGNAVSVAFTSLTNTALGTTQNLVAAALGNDGLAVLDVTDPPASRVLANIPVAGSALTVEVVDNLAYVGGHGGLVTILDMKTRETIATFVVAGNGDVSGLKFSGGVLYTLRGGTIGAYDLNENLAAPPLRSSLAVGGTDLFVGNDRAYITGNQVFEVVDITNPSNLRNTSGPRPALNYSGLAVNGSGRLVVGSTANFNADFRVSLFNVENPDDTNDFLTEFETPGQVRDVWIQNGLALIADGTGGLSVFNYLSADQGSTAPTITVTTNSPDGTTVNEGQRLRVDVLTLDDVQTRQVRLVANGVALEPDGSFPFSFFVDVPTLDGGNNTLTLEITATDSGGNESSTVRTFTIIEDNIAPVLLTTIPPDDRIQFSSVQSFRATFSEPLALTSLTTDSIRLVEAGLDGTLGTADDVTIPIANFDYRLSVNLLTVTPAAPMGPGKYELQLDRAEVTDRAGNALGTGTFRSQFTIQAIPFNSVINGSIDQAGEIDLYSFLAQAGDQVTIWGNWGVGGTNLIDGQVSLLGTDGVTILATAQGNGSSLLADVTLPTAGLYTIRIRAATDHPLAEGAYQFTISDPETAAETIAYGESQTRSIAVRGDDHEWQFTATAGDLVNFAYVGPNLEGGLRMINPDGTTESVMPAGSVLVRAAVPVAQTGTYRFVVDTDLSAGSYTIQIDQGRFGDDRTGLYNAVQSGNLSRLYEADRFMYTLAAGEEITIFADMGGIGAGTIRLVDMATGLDLVTPKSGSSAQISRYVSPTAANVAVVLSGVSGTAFRIGTYTLTVSDPETVAETLTFGQEVARNFAVRGDSQEWQFVAAGGEVVTLGYRGPTLTQGFTIRKPDNSILATVPAGSTRVVRDLVLDQAGTYTFVLADDTATGSYTLNLSNPADVESPGTSLTANTARTDAIATVFDIDVFTFTATAGDTFSILAEWSPTGGSLTQGEFTLIDPNGTVVNTVSGSTASSLGVASAIAGNYVVRVRAASGYDFNMGAYRLTAYRGAEVPTNDTTSTAVATGLNGSTSTHYEANGFIGDNFYGVRDVDMYQVNATRGDQIVIDIEAAPLGSTLNSYVRLFDANGQQLATNDNFASSSDSYLSYTVLLDGNYFIGVSSSGNGSYNPATAGSGSAGTVGQYRVLLDVARDNEGPIVTSVTPTGVSTQEDLTQLVIQFNERLNVVPATNAANYQLVSTGDDGIFDTGDDVTYGLTAAYDDGNRRVTVTTLDGADAGTAPDPLPRGYGYRLTMVGQGSTAITDIANNRLNNGSNHVSYLSLESAVGTPTTTFPFTDGFEGGTTLANYWTVSTSGGARVNSVNTDTPQAGTFHAKMDNPGSTGRSALILNINLSALATNADVDLSFHHRDNGDGNNSMPSAFAGRVNADGVAISADGVNWRRIVDLGATTDSTYNPYVIDLDGVMQAAGINFTSQFQVMFQHYLGGGQTAYFDNIRLAADLAGPTVTAVSTSNALVFSNTLNSATVDFSEPIQSLTANAASSYELKRLDTGATVALTPSYDNDRRVTLSFATLVPARYELRIRGNTSVGGTTQIRDASGNLLNNGTDSVYTFELINREVTPNDEFGTSTATGLTSGNSYSITTAIGNNNYGGRDVDMYLFTAAAGDRLTATLYSQDYNPVGLNTYMRLFNAAGEEIASNDDLSAGDTDSQINSFQIPAAGAYYLGISSATNDGYNPAIAPSGTSGPIGKYQMNVSLARDTTSPTITKVVPHAGPNINQSLSSLDITFSEPIVVAAANNIANYTVLHLGADRQVGGGDDTPYTLTAAYNTSNYITTLTLTAPESLLPLPAGAYRLIVKGTTGGITDIAGNRLGGGVDYNHSFTVIRPEDPLNDRLADAVNTQISSNGGSYSVEAAIGDNAFEARDVDLYRFEARDGLRLTMTLTDYSIGSPLSARIRLFNSAGTELTASEYYWGNDSLTYDFTAEGTYYIGVSGSGNYTYNPASPGSGAAANTTGEYILSIVTQDLTDPTVASVNPSSFVVGNNVRDISVRFSEPMDVTGAEAPSNYRLVHAGSDRTFGTADDANLTFTPRYDVPTRTTILTTPTALPNGDIRLTLVAANLMDRAGRRLNGGVDAQYFLGVITTGSSLPFTDGLDAPPLGSTWYVPKNDVNAVASIITSNSPRRGAGHLQLTGNLDHRDTNAAAILAVQTTSSSPLQLTFYSKQTNNGWEDRPQLPASFTGNPNGDGVAISADGNQWYRVVDLATVALGQYVRHTVDLASVASTNGLTLGGILLVRFSNYEYHLHSSEPAVMYIDDVRIGADATAPTVTSVSPGTFISQSSTNTVGLVFSEAVNDSAAATVANYTVVRAGNDAKFGTADDVTLTLSSVTYDGPSRTASLQFASALPLDSYRVTVSPAITDLNGVPLNDGLAQVVGFDVAPTEASENDTVSTATSTGITSVDGGDYTTTGAIGNNSQAGRDVDYYSIAGTASQRLLVRLSRFGAMNSDVRVRVFNQAGTQVATAVTTTGTDTATLSFLLTSTENYYIGISAATNTGYLTTVAGSGSAGPLGLYNVAIEVRGGVAKPPFSDGFEVTPLDPYWTIYKSDTTGVADVSTLRAFAGTNSLLLGDTDYSYTLVESTLAFDGTRLAHTDLSFHAMYSYYEGLNAFTPSGGSFTGHYSGDGVAFSVDGNTWYPLVNFAAAGTFPTYETWTPFTIDLNAAAAAKGVSLSTTTRIRFQNYAYGPAGSSIYNYGIYIENVQLNSDLVPPTVTTMPGLDGLAVSSTLTSLPLTFSEALDTATASLASNYSLRSDGPDGIFDNSDDVVYTLTPTYSSATMTTTLAISGVGSGLPADTYRLRLTGTGSTPIRDLIGNAINNGSNRDYVFAVFPPEGTTNNTLTTATATGLTSTGGGYQLNAMLGNDSATTTATFNDIDMYAFTAAANQTLNVRATSGFGTPNLRMRLFDSAGNQVTFLDPSSSNDLLLDSFRLSAAGTYYLGISASDNDTYNPNTGTGDTGTTRGLYGVIIQLLSPAVFPFSDGFESGQINPTYWDVYGHYTGTVDLRTTVPTPLAGTQSALLYPTSINQYGQSDLTLHVNLAGQTNAELRFQERNNYDYNYGGTSPASYTGRYYGTDGVFLSVDGSTFYRIPTVFNEAPSSTILNRLVDLDEFAALNGLVLSADTHIRFQSYNYNYGYGDQYLGRSLDSVQVIADGVGPQITRLTTDGNNTATSVLAENVTTFTATFDDRLRIDRANSASAYELRFAGADGLFLGQSGDTGDDVIIPVTPSYDGNYTVTLTIPSGQLPLAGGAYRLTFRGTGASALEDREGNVLGSGTDDVRAFTMVDGGPRVTAHTPTSTVAPATGFSSFTLTFNEAVLGSSFTGADVAITDYYDGTVLVDPANITVSGSGTAWTVSFPNMQTPGYYGIRVGPNVTDLGGRAMNQDRDLINGESNDVYAFQVMVSDSTSTILYDQGGFKYDINNNYGLIADGGRIDTSSGSTTHSDSYDSMYYFTVDGNTYYNSSGAYAVEDSGRTVVLSSQTVNGLRVQREIYVPSTEQFVRYLDSFTNNSTQSIKRRVVMQGNLGSDGATVVTLSSSGDLSFQTSDNYLATDDADGSGTLSLGHLMMDGTRQGLVTAIQSTDSLSWGYDLVVAPGQTVRLLTFGTQQLNRASAHAQLTNLVALPAAALANISTAEKGSIVNFNTGSDTIAPAISAMTPDIPQTQIDPVNNFVATFTERLNATTATAAANFSLREAGTDNTFDTGDDRVITLTPTYNDTLRQITLAIASGSAPLALGRYRLTIESDITDLAGNTLSGGDAVYTFTVSKAGPYITNFTPGTTTPSPGWSTFNVTFNEAIEASSFTSTDIVIGSYETGATMNSANINVNGSGTTWTVTFPAIQAVDEYYVNIGPNILNTTGQLMNQDRDRNNGESYDDIYYNYVYVTDTGSTTLDDSGSFRYDIDETYGVVNSGGYFPSGATSSSNGYPYNGAPYLYIDGSYYYGSGAYRLDDSGRTVVTSQRTMSNLQVHREVYVPTASQFVRFMDVFTNPTNAAVTRTVMYETYLDSMAFISGNGAFDLTDTSLVTDDGTDGGTDLLAIGHVFMDAQALAMASASSSGGYLVWSFNVTVPANGTVRLLTFNTQQLLRSSATTEATRLVGLPTDALANLTTAERASILNFNAGGSLRLATPTERPRDPVQLTGAVSEAIVAEARRRWGNLGIDLGSIAVQFADLGGSTLGIARDGLILIDRDAAGYGWFVDSTPQDEAEFDQLGTGHWRAKDDSDADQRVDLLTVVMHELGHLAGIDHGDGLMNDTLELSERWDTSSFND